MSAAARPRLRSFLYVFRFSLLAAALLLLLSPQRVRAQAWVDALRLGPEVRFLFSGEVKRYDTVTRTWLTPVPLPRTGATAMAWDAQNCYIAYGTSIFSYTAALTGEATFASASTSVHSLFVDGNVLLAVHSQNTTSKVTSWFRNTRAQISTRDTSTWSLYGSSHAPGLNRIFGRSQSISPPDISYSSYTSGGVISATVDGPDHGDHPDATRTWVAGDELRVFDTSGTVYRTSDLAHVGSVGGTITDVAFNQDIPVVLRGSTLISYKNNLLEAGRRTLTASTGAEVQIDATSAYVFRPATPNPLVEIVALADLNMPAAGQPLDATGLAFQPHTVFKDRNGLICLYSVNFGFIFRWDPAQKAYTTPVALTTPTTATTFLAYNNTFHRIYIGNLNTIRQMDALPGAVSTSFATTADNLYGMATAGDLVYTSYRNNSRCYLANGTAQPLGGSYGGRGSAWDPVKRRMYHFEDELLVSELVYETIATDGRITGSGVWPDPTNDLYNRSFPIRVSPDGGTLVLGEGGVFNTNNITITTDLDTRMADMEWFNGAFVSIEELGSATRLQRWSPSWQRQASLLLNGTPLRVMPLSATQLLVITMHDGVPRFHLLDEEYVPQFDSVNEAPEIVTAPLGAEVDYRTNWTFTVEAVGSPDLEYQWLKDTVAIPGATEPSLTLTNVGSGDTADYRCRVTNSFGVAATSGVMLFVGPVNPPVYTAGNLLVSSGRKVNEYTPSGVLQSTMPIPVPTSNTPASHIVGDVAVDRFGRLQVLNEGRTTDNVPRYFLSTFDPRRQRWAHRAIGNLGSLPDSYGRDITMDGDWMWEKYYKLNITTSEVIRHDFPGTVIADELNAGLDGKLYSFYRGNSIVRRHALDLTVQGEWDLGSLLLTGITADATGRYFVSDSNSMLRSYENGSLRKSFTPTGTFGGFTDVSVSATGRIAAGGISGPVAVSDSNLTSNITIDPATGSASYTAWVPVLVRPTPSLTNTPAAPAATEDVLYTWTPMVDHPDPDAVITLSLTSRPPWLSVAGNTLTGTPLQAHVGSNVARLRATDATGAFVEREFTFPVIEVNDRPAAADQTVTVDEDAAPVLLDLSTVFTDEETPFASLTRQITASTGVAAVPALDGGSLRLTFPPDANGDATVTVSATDAGGLSVDAVVTISVRPVNDPPSFPAAPPVINAGPAAPDAAIDLLPLLRDPDAGDTHTWRLSAVTNPDIFTSVSVDDSGRLEIRYAPYRSGESDISVEVKDAAGTTATLTFKVTLPELPAPQVAVNAALVLNRQTGLWEHRITVRNDAQRAIGGFEAKVTDLPAGSCLYNASDCTAAAQLAGYYAPIAPGASVTMVLEYHNPLRAPLAPQLAINTALPQAPATNAGDGLAIDRIVTVPGGILLEFTAVPGHLYQVQYSDDNTLWLDSLVRIRAAGNRVQWLDQGPPRTHSAPAPGGQRFYRVKEVTEP